MASNSHLRKPDSTEIRRQWATVAETPLRLEQRDTERIVDALNTELSGLYILFNQIRKHYWTFAGAEHRHLAAFLEGAADRLAELTDDIAIRVHALGGVPVCGPMGMRQHAPVDIEAPDVYDGRTSLENDLDGYATLAVSMRDHIRLADEIGDEATSEILRRAIRDLEEDAATLDKYLADDTLLRRDDLR